MKPPELPFKAHAVLVPSLEQFTGNEHLVKLQKRKSLPTIIKKVPVKSPFSLSE